MHYRPSELRFTQISISPYFSYGESIHDEIDRIKSLWSWNRSEALNKFLPLEVRQDNYDGKMYCNNNRRLYMFRVLENEGYVTKIKTKRGGMRPKALNAGCHIKFRGEKKSTTNKHCSCNNSNCCVM